MVKRSELVEAAMKTRVLRQNMTEKYYGRENQCAFHSDDSHIIFDESGQYYMRVDDDTNDIMATRDVENLQDAIAAAVLFMKTGEMDKEVPY